MQRVATNLDLGYMIVLVVVFQPDTCDAGGGCANGGVVAVGIVLGCGNKCVYLDRCGGRSGLT